MKLNKFNFGCILVCICFIFQILGIYEIFILALVLLPNRIIAIYKNYTINEIKEKKKLLCILCIILLITLYETINHIISQPITTELFFKEFNHVLTFLNFYLYLIFP